MRKPWSTAVKAARLMIVFTETEIDKVVVLARVLALPVYVVRSY